MSKPIVDFIFIGPSKTASTWIFENLRVHPSVYIPIAKDIYFFDKFYDKGIRWYESFFQNAPQSSLCGELSHDYFSDEEAIKRIYTYNPKVKLICCLRNPFDRAYSSHLHRQRLGLATNGLAADLELAPKLLDEGMYFLHISNIYKIFPRESLLILDYDNLTESPEVFIKKIYSYLSIDENFLPIDLNERVNQAKNARNIYLARILKFSAVKLRNLGFANLVGRLKHNKIINKIIFTNRGNGEHQTSARTAEFPKEVVTIYNKELAALSRLLQTDFSKWVRLNNIQLD